MPTETLAGDGPELQPHPRVTAKRRDRMLAGLGAMANAVRDLQEPVRSTHQAFTVANSLAQFAHPLGAAIADPSGTDLAARAKNASQGSLLSAISSLAFCLHLIPDQVLDTASCESARSELLDFAGDIKELGYKYPYRRFLSWWMVAVATATRYARAAQDVVSSQACDRAYRSLQKANAAPPVPLPDLSNGYLDKDDIAALCFTDTETAGRWAVRFSGTDDPFPTYDLLDHRRVLWHADRAPEIRAWWLRHDELPVAEHPTRTPGHRFGDRWLAPTP